MRSIVIPVMVGILFLFSCTKQNDNRRILEEAGQIGEFRPDSVLDLLSEIGDPEKLLSADKADYVFLLSRAHMRMGKAMTEDSLILYARDYYKEKNIQGKLPMAYMLTANYYRWREDSVAFRKEIMEGINWGVAEGDSSLVGNMYGFWSSFEFDNRNYLQAIEHSRNGIRYKPVNDPGHSYNIGLSYSRMGMRDSADYYFKRSVDLYKEKGYKRDVEFTRRNYADHLSSKGRYKESLKLHYENMTELGDTAHLSIAENYLSLGQQDSARFYIDRLKESGVELYTTAANRLMASQAVLDYAQGEPIKWGRIGVYNDSVYFKNDRDRKLLEEKIVLKSQLERKNLLLTISRQRMQQYITWGLLMIIAIGCLIVWYIMRKKKLLADAEEKREVLETLLKEVSDTNDGKSIFAKKVVLQQLGLIRIVANTPTAQNQQLLKQVSLINNKDVNIDHILVWEDFYKVVDSIYEGFHSHIIACYGEKLTEKELQLCSLLRAGFSTKEISVLTGQKFQTIYQRKTIIRQKLQMDEKEDIVVFMSE